MHGIPMTATTIITTSAKQNHVTRPSTVPLDLAMTILIAERTRNERI
ncbi:unnamed protein product [Haemonchus placei]|uniref:Uncharacterized protein n=1 Tax=Haemonchus placei TaxID=6290 RepID=A0A3P8AP22_HAEPC|nr:unnamed protein product [Haemonchus placei]